MASIDIVIPCYNYGRFLSEAVSSVLSQGIEDLRVLIIDNASTDESADVARELAARDSKVQVSLHTVNQGATASYNEGIDWAEADYFLVLDADDMLAPGALRRAMNIMEKEPGIAFTHGIELNCRHGETLPSIDNPADGRWKITPGLKYIEDTCLVPVCIVGANTVIRRTSAQKAVGYYRKTLPYSDDFEMWLRLATVGDVASTGVIQAIRRIHTAQHSEQFRSAQHRDFNERERAFASFFAHEGKVLPNRERLMRQVRVQLGKHAYWSSVSHYYRGRKDVAAELMRFSRERRGMAGFVPPLDWLLRMKNPVRRMKNVVREAAARRTLPHP